MKTFFLSADKPIVKSYELDPKTGELIKHSYPFVYEVTSHEENIPDLKTLATVMGKYAKLGACMLKGQLSRPLVAESRKGSTDPDQKTDWICLDLDGVDNYQTVDLFLDDIGCGDTDHVVQWSSSMGVENKAGFRCHIFMKLAQPVHPQMLKYWLQGINLSVDTLSSQLELTKTGNSLRWPLDVTTCQNDKLLYIAPPKLGPGIKDPYPKNTRISFQKRSKQLLVLPYPLPTKDSIRERVDVKVNELRVQAHLPVRKKTKYKFSGGTEYLQNPDQATITGQKTERGFVYFNLNGGDSWAYYHPEDRPEFILNFKGEPAYKTEELLPEYWASLQSAAASYTPNSQGLIHFAFRDFRSSNYYNGSYNTATDKLTLAMAKNESQIRQYAKQHGLALGECVPDWNLVWNPNSPLVVNSNTCELNVYEPSQLSLNYKPGAHRAPTVPPTIKKVIDHVLGYDQPTIDHFMNWLACVVQYLTKTGTAWVWQGTQGTGKGVLFHSIITPLMGEPNVVAKRFEEIESEFTGFMENKFIAFIDEIEAGKSLYHSKITAKLKNLIVEPHISIRKMYHPAYMAPNYASMIFASNKNAPVEVPPDDRRFNVGPYQKQPIQLTATEVDDLIPKELPEFYAYLRAYPADQARARTPLQSQARTNLIQVNRTAIDTVSDAILAGNLEFLWDHMPSDARQLNPTQQIRYTPFRELVVDLVTHQDPKLTRDDLYVIMEWCVGGMPQSPHKFTAVLKHHNLPLTQVWKNNRNVRGIHVNWVIDPAWLAQAQLEIKNGAV